MTCIINGDTFTFSEDMSIQDILKSLELDPDRTVVEHNAELIDKTVFPQRIVRQDDKLEFLEFVGGG